MQVFVKETESKGPSVPIVKKRCLPSSRMITCGDESQCPIVFRCLVRARPAIHDRCMTEETLQEFIELWEEEFGEKIERGDAEVRAKQLVTLFTQLMVAMAEQEPKRKTNDDPR